MQNYGFLGTLQKKALYNFPNLKKRITFAVGFADMAQLVEQRIRNAWVRGSSPLIGSNRKKECWEALFFRFLRLLGNLFLLGCRSLSCCSLFCCCLLLSRSRCSSCNYRLVVFQRLGHKIL